MCVGGGGGGRGGEGPRNMRKFSCPESENQKRIPYDYDYRCANPWGKYFIF